MNRNVTIRIPNGSRIRQKIRDIYTDLRTQWRRANPFSTSYSTSKLRQNIRNALSIHRRVFKEEQFSRSSYTKWGNGIIIYYSHFYWLVNFRQDRKGNIIADVIDACYEGDYHNDIMNTTPYGEGSIRNLNKEILKEYNNNTMNRNKKIVRLTESDLHNMITEAVKDALNELDPRTHSSAAEKARLRGEFDRARKFKKSAFDAWERDYGDELDIGRGGRSQFVDPRYYDGVESLGNGEPYVCNNYFDGSGDCYNPKSKFRMPFNKKGNGLVGMSVPSTKGERVASQMIHGDGKYVKGRGWQ